MKYYKKILAWENKRRLNKLIEFNNLVHDYLNNSRASWKVDDRIEEDSAREARIKINRILDEIQDIVLSSGICPSITSAPTSAVGGYVQNVDLILNFFNLHGWNIREDMILDVINRAIGKYESNHKPSLIRTINPFFYIVSVPK